MTIEGFEARNPVEEYKCEGCKNCLFSVQVTVMGEDSFLLCHDCAEHLINRKVDDTMLLNLLSSQHHTTDYYLRK